jgi:hypothetical protein
LFPEELDVVLRFLNLKIGVLALQAQKHHAGKLVAQIQIKKLISLVNWSCTMKNIAKLFCLLMIHKCRYLVILYRFVCQSVHT